VAIPNKRGPESATVRQATLATGSPAPKYSFNLSGFAPDLTHSLEME
jgi:hypothetical protein